MIRKEITFTDYNGEEQTEAFWFNLNKAELLRLQFGVKGMDFQAVLQEMIKDKEGGFIMDAVEDVILKSIGQRTEDGKGFVKDPEYVKAFKSTEAYSELFTELCTDAENGAIFMNGLVPANMQKPVAEVKAQTAEEIRKASLAQKGGFNQKVVTERPKVSLAEAQAMQAQGGVSAAIR